MAITTYAELQTAITNWSDRSDLSSLIPDFITLAEKRIIRDINIKGGLRILDSSATITPVSNVAALPADFYSIRNVLSSGTPNNQIEAVSLDTLQSVYSLSGTGYAYCVVGSNILLSPDAGEKSVILYYNSEPAVLSGTNTSNTLFASAPDLYLYGALIELAGYIQSDPSQWVNLYSQAISSLMQADRLGKWGSNLRVRAY